MLHKWIIAFFVALKILNKDNLLFSFRMHKKIRFSAIDKGNLGIQKYIKFFCQLSLKQIIDLIICLMALFFGLQYFIKFIFNLFSLLVI